MTKPCISPLVFMVTLLCATSASAALAPPPFDAANFTPGQAINNQYWPLIPGTNQVYISQSEDGCEAELFSITNQTKSDFPPPYDSIVATVITDQSWLDPDCSGDYALIETTTDWYAQDDYGNIWYFGESTTAYDDPTDCPSAAGSWEAGVNGAQPGIVMLAYPTNGATYEQEFAADEAEDNAKVLRLNVRVSTALARFTDCLVTKEWSPLEHGYIEHKFYCPDGGGLVLITELHGGTARTEFIGDTLPPGNYAAAGVCEG